MAGYVVGDIQGCLDPLRRLLDSLAFDPAHDRLWAVGDLVNRGPASLETLRWLRGLGSAFETVLGNHDLHLLAVANGVRPAHPRDTLEPVLRAPDRDELLAWLAQRPFLLHAQGVVVVHAGIPPQWSLATAAALAAEVEVVLRTNPGELLAGLYGDQPDWDPGLRGPPRWRAIVNALTRMRFCTETGALDLRTKTGPDQPPPGMLPWYAHPGRLTRGLDIAFGHWAALDGADCGPGLFPLDTGCVWGRRLRLLDLTNRRYHHCACGDRQD
ncbi:MAG: symmetrical bis(5'-nucleosyl)-tetraphosphatase [Pseudomonadota bacterium]